MRSIEHIKKIENFCIDPLSIILGPVIPKPKVEICCLALVFYNEKIKNEEAQGILKFGHLCEFLRFFKTFCIFLLNFAPKKVC